MGRKTFLSFLLVFLLILSGCGSPAVTQDKIVIWISPQFREEHRQALDWLNENTGEDQAFFGIEIKLVRTVF